MLQYFLLEVLECSKIVTYNECMFGVVKIDFSSRDVTVMEEIIKSPPNTRVVVVGIKYRMVMVGHLPLLVTYHIVNKLQ